MPARAAKDTPSRGGNGLSHNLSPTYRSARTRSPRHRRYRAGRLAQPHQLRIDTAANASQPSLSVPHLALARLAVRARPVLPYHDLPCPVRLAHRFLSLETVAAWIEAEPSERHSHS